jgi:DeoR family transcriptional regulator, aga operon transcriptional repressor
MHQAERLTAILDRISGDGSLTVADIARQLGVSTATIRRDLQRLVTRTHGGAVSQAVLYELPLQYREDTRKAEKRRIAAAAAALVTDGNAVGLSGGTTTTEVARALVDRQHLTVITNALNIAAELAIRPHIKIVVTGGVARSESYELVGPLAEATLREIFLDIVFIGADGISLDAGLTTHHEVEAHTNQALTDRARRVVAVADSTKIGLVRFARICPIGRLDDLITDDSLDPEAAQAFRNAGVAVHTV